MSAENNKTILLVEDELTTARGEKRILEKFGYKVIVAKSGEEAVATVKKTPVIDLILMDINLGSGIDGTEAAAIILQQRDIPVVFLSSHTEPEIVEKTEKITSYGYVAKASSNTVLDASIKMAFKLFEAKIKEKEKEAQMEAALAALKKSEERFRQLAEVFPETIFEANIKGDITYSNKHGLECFGYTEADIASGVNILNLISPIDRNLALMRMQEKMQGIDNGYFEYQALRKDGSIFHVMAFSAPIMVDGMPIGIRGFILDNSERKRVEEQILIANERLQYLLSSTSVVIYSSKPSGHFGATFISKNIVQMVGYDPKEFTGDSNFWFDHVHPEDQPIISEEVPKVFEKEFHAYAYRFRCGDGRYIWVSDQMKLVRDNDGNPIEIIGFWEDISERKQAEASLKQAFDWQQTIFEGSRDAIFISDQDSRFVAVNNAACDLTGYSREQLLKMRIPDIHDLPDLDAYKLYHQRIFAGEEILSEAKILRSDSAKIDTEFNNRCVSIAGKLYMHTTARKISERKKVEEEIKRQLAEKEILLREVHHRIKNNIASIGGLLSLHMQSISNPEAVAVLQEAIGRVNSMRILYDKLLFSEDFKQISAKNYVESLIDTVVAIFPENSRIKLDKHIADFQLDAKRLFPLGIIINELITNIMKHAFINRDSGLIKIALENVKNHVTLTIQDNGIGLPDGFDIAKAKGFGLILVQMLTQQLGGSFAIENDTGTRCSIEFNI
jgi:PAS domain S-box-containing protein